MLHQHSTRERDAYTLDISTRLQNPYTRRSYRVLSIFGAGAGLPAALGKTKTKSCNRRLLIWFAGLLAGIYDASIESGEWITYACIDGVSAGALITAFIAHTNMLNPYEIVQEIEWLMDQAQIALRTRVFQLTPSFSNMMFRNHHASICNYDDLTKWMGKLIEQRRKHVLQRHAQLQAEVRQLKVEYPIVRIQYCDLESQSVSKLTYQEGLNGVGVCFRDLLSGAFASAAIPLAFEAQGVGWKGLLSRAGVDGCVAGMGMRPQPDLLKLFKPGMRPMGGDMLVANSTRINTGFTEDQFTQHERKKLNMNTAITSSISAIVKQLCTISITDTKQDWERMFRDQQTPCRIFSHSGMANDEVQPSLDKLTAENFYDMFYHARMYARSQARSMHAGTHRRTNRGTLQF